jgi:hypothetical protein
MKLVNINKNGTQKFQLKDGRFILSYTSGYVRIDSGLDRLYQINKVKRYNFEDFNYYYERVLIPCPSERFQYIVDWVNRNVKDVPYTLTRQLIQKTNIINHFKNKYGNY